MNPPLGALRALAVLWWLGARSGDDGAESARRPHASMSAGVNVNDKFPSRALVAAEVGPAAAVALGLAVDAVAAAGVSLSGGCRDGGADAGRGDCGFVARRLADEEEEGGVVSRLLGRSVCAC